MYLFIPLFIFIPVEFVIMHFTLFILYFCNKNSIETNRAETVYSLKSSPSSHGTKISDGCLYSICIFVCVLHTQKLDARFARIALIIISGISWLTVLMLIHWLKSMFLFLFYFFFLFLHLMILVGIANVIYAIYWILFILFHIGNKMWFCFYLHVVSLILLFEPRLWSNSKTLHVVLGLECRCRSIVRFDGAQLDGGKLCRAETKNWRRRTDIGLVNISGHHHECV